MKRTELRRKTEMKRSYIKRKHKVPNYDPFQASCKRNKKPKRTTYTRELREYIHERDEYCRVCGCAGDQVHHVITRKRHQVHPEWYTFTDMHDERNLMWICWVCHDRAHKDEANLQKVIKMQEARFGPLRKEGAA